MDQFYCIVIDQDEGNNEDYNFNYLEANNFEAYFTKEERDERLEFLNEVLFEKIKEESGAVFGAMPFDIKTPSYSLVPEFLAAGYDVVSDITDSGLEITAPDDEGEEVTFTVDVPPDVLAQYRQP